MSGFPPAMTRVAWLIFCALLLIVSQPRVGEAPFSRSPVLGVRPVAAVGPEPAAPSVRIAHQIVHVKATSVERARPKLLREGSQARTAARQVPVREKIESRARRILFGDGTYRPQPFPRPAKN